MNGALIEINLIDQAMLNVDSPRVEPGKIAYQLLVMRSPVQILQTHPISQGFLGSPMQTFN